MIYDIHAHIVGMESGASGNYLCPARRMNLPLRILLAGARRRAAEMNSTSLDEGLCRLIGQWADESRVDRIVLLALDGVYHRDGKPDLERTQVVVGNDYVADCAAGHPKLLFGASIHPYRRDALEELDRAAGRGACLIKWLPSAQRIDPDDPVCERFYERLALHGIPLLSHTGPEHTLARFSNSLNDPRRLAGALRRGVTVIAAHCGTRMYLYERSWFGAWAEMTRRFPNFYGDLSTFALPLRGGPWRRILKDPHLLSRVVYGSDFPTPAMPLWYGPTLGWRRARELNGMENPFDKTLRTLERLGAPQEVFSRAGELLRLPAAQPVFAGGLQ